MPYQDFVRPGKALTTGDQIASGSIELRHFSPALFAEFRQIQLHPHSGVKSVRIKLSDLDGWFTANGYLMRSPNGNLWRITIDNSGNLGATAA